ncbi:MAG: carboxypeptidase M32 [Azoarcus sp.]|nr:carboxypeptidase M32 [Azoarcus sp.]
MSTPSAYAELVAAHARLYRFDHLAAILSWDRSTMMPPGGSAARAAADAELRGLIHGLRRAPRLAELIQRAGDEALDDVERANLREMRRDWLEANALPETLASARALAGARCEHAWRSQRPANDWSGFLSNFREVVHLAREEAVHLADATGLAPYDTLLDRYEPGMRTAVLDRLFGALQTWMPDLVAHAQEAQRNMAVIVPAGPFPLADQRRLCHALMEVLGFDFSAGRLDQSAHPFTGGVAEDVRITTRYDERDFLPALNSTLHETGHARYAQGLPRAWLSQPLGRPRSYAIHESQSLLLEMQVGRSREFAEVLAPLLRTYLGERAGFDADNLHRLLARVAPGRIRVSADEASYPAHVIVRYQIERALISGEIEAEDIPTLWDEKMLALLGVDTRGNYGDGCMQDVHWTDGAFGYFPSYTLGAMYAAQWFAEVRRTTPEIGSQIAVGNLQALFDWLDANIWSQASRWETSELVCRASGTDLDPAHFRAHLEARYLGAH